jgi:hypothetical protein
MNKLLLISISLLIFISRGHGQEITAKVFNPTDKYPASYSVEYAGKPVIYDFMKPLILQLQQDKPSDFISAGDANGTLKWRLQHFTIISGDVVAVNFTEGHVDVIGIFVRDFKEKRWKLATEFGGIFKTRFYDEVTGEPKSGESGRRRD